MKIILIMCSLSLAIVLSLSISNLYGSFGLESIHSKHHLLAQAWTHTIQPIREIEIPIIMPSKLVRKDKTVTTADVDDSRGYLVRLFDAFARATDTDEPDGTTGPTTVQLDGPRSYQPDNPTNRHGTKSNPEINVDPKLSKDQWDLKVENGDHTKDYQQPSSMAPGTVVDHQVDINGGYKDCDNSQ